MKRTRFALLCVLAAGAAATIMSAAADPAAPAVLPVPLDAYPETADTSLIETLRARIASVPFNLAATLIFFLAICHTFLTAKFRHWAHVAEERHAATRAQRPIPRQDSDEDGVLDEVSFKGQMLHFLGEVEAVF